MAIPYPNQTLWNTFPKEVVTSGAGTSLERIRLGLSNVSVVLRMVPAEGTVEEVNLKQVPGGAEAWVFGRYLLADLRIRTWLNCTRHTRVAARRVTRNQVHK
jgi:hypothetical protein